jgi:hypothetical protein
MIRNAYYSILLMTRERSHLAQTLHWSRQEETQVSELLMAGFGMSVPIACAALVGQLPLGLAASVGALAVSGVAITKSLQTQAKEFGSIFAPTALAAIAASLCARNGLWTYVAEVLLTAGAAAIGGYSRSLATACMRFCLILIISANVMDTHAHHAGLLLPMALGALWVFALSLLFVVLAPACIETTPATGTTIAATAAQRLARWRRTMSQLAGWQYVFRLAFGLTVAGFLQWQLPEHHLSWVALTVVILTRRQPEPQSVKTTQRALGTLVGVLVASIFLAFTPPVAVLIVAIFVLSGMRSILRARNYLAYSVLMTPLMVLLMDGSPPVSGGVLWDRLFATLIGSALVILARAAFRKITVT